MTDTVTIKVENLNQFLKAMNRFPQEANDAMRMQSRSIADRVMVPALRAEAMKVPHYGALLAADIRSTRDRVPMVKIGTAKIVAKNKNSRGKMVRKKVQINGKTYTRNVGASTIMLRYPTDSGDWRNSFYSQEGTRWIETAAKRYKPIAYQMWVASVDAVTKKWNATR